MGQIVTERDVTIDGITGMVLYDSEHITNGGSNHSGILLDSSGRVSHLVTLNPSAAEKEDVEHMRKDPAAKDLMAAGTLPSGHTVILDSLADDFGGTAPALPEFLAAWLLHKEGAKAERPSQSREERAIDMTAEEINGIILAHGKQWLAHLEAGEQSPDTIGREAEQLHRQLQGEMQRRLAKNLLAQAGTGKVHEHIFSGGLSTDLLNALIGYHRDKPKSGRHPNV